MLSDTTIKYTKPKDKPYKIPDERGMYLLITPAGSRYFRLDYTFEGKRKTLALGVYPDTTLRLAREKHAAARQLLAAGIDPNQAKKEAKTAKANTFELITREWLSHTTRSIQPITQTHKLRRFELHVFPVIGCKSIAEITPVDVANALKQLIGLHKYQTARKVCSEVSSVFDYAIANGLVMFDPAQSVSRQLPVHKTINRPALTEPKDVASLMRSIYSYSGTFTVQCALKLSPLLFQRPGEIRTMLWEDINLDSREWRYRVTKTSVDHIVPLSSQACSILAELRPATCLSRYVFPSNRELGKPMSGNTVRTALFTLGYASEQIVPHGFRAMASTLLNEMGFNFDAIEAQLAHSPKDQIRAAYNRARYLPERVRMMQAWADYLDALRLGTNVVPLHKTG